MARKAIGEVDAQPGGPKPAIGERGAARIGFGTQRRGAWGRQAGHGLAMLHGDQGSAPLLGGGFEEQGQENVERPEPDTQAMHCLAVDLFEVGDRAERGLARHHAASIGEHRGQRPHAGWVGRVARCC